MRRFAILAAILGISLVADAQAAPPLDQFQNRLRDFDQRYSPSRRTSAREETADYQEETRPPATGRRDAPSQGAPEQVEPYHDGDMWEGDGYWDDGGYGCNDGCCDPCCRGGFFSRNEYLQWWVQGANTPPLVTSDPNDGILPNATVLFGNERIQTAGNSGARFTMGYNFGACSPFTVEDTFFFLGKSGDTFFANSNGNPLLARPFLNTLTGDQDANLIAFPGIVTGNVSVNSTQQLLGNEINLRRGLSCGCFSRWQVLAGYRYFYLRENLNASTATVSIDPANPNIAVGTTFDIFDNFKTINQFHGGQLGLDYQWAQGCWTVNVLGKVALGGVAQKVNINGATTVTVPTTEPVTSAGGVLALASNSGLFTRNHFAVLPELGVNLNYQWTQYWKVNVGYTIMWLTNVVRPGDQIDTRLDPNQFPPPIANGTFPRFEFRDTDIWLQGINVGIEYCF